MTDRICPKCTSAMVIKTLDREHVQTGWQCTTCGLEWIELGQAVVFIPHPSPAIDPISGGHIE